MTGAVGVGGVPTAKGAETELAVARGTAGAGVETTGAGAGDHAGDVGGAQQPPRPEGFYSWTKAAAVRKETACKVEMGGASTGAGAVATSGAAAGMANWGAMAGPAEGGAAVAGAAAEDAAVAPKKKGKTRGGKKLQPGHQRHRNKKG